MGQNGRNVAAKIPTRLAGGEFEKTWGEFTRYRQDEKASPMGKREQEGLLTRLAKRGAALATALLRDSMDHGWKSADYPGQADGLRVEAAPTPRRQPRKLSGAESEGRERAICYLAAKLPVPYRYEVAGLIDHGCIATVDAEMGRIEGELARGALDGLSEEARGAIIERVDSLIEKLRPGSDEERIRDRLLRMAVLDREKLPRLSILDVASAWDKSGNFDLSGFTAEKFEERMTG